MEYSVFDWNLRRYRVYRDGRAAPVMGDAPDCPPGAPAYMGMRDVTASLCPVPKDAQLVGTSPTARGRVSRLPGRQMLGVPASESRRRGGPTLGRIPGLGGPRQGQGASTCSCGALGQETFLSRDNVNQIAGNVFSLTLSGLLTGWLTRRLGIL